VSATEWDNWFRSTIGKAPNAKNNYVRFAAYVVEGTSKVRLGGPDTWFAAKAISVTPIALDITIEENYYLLGTINGWSVAEAIKFNHSEANVYDDPIFTLNFEISEEEAAAIIKDEPEKTTVLTIAVGDKVNIIDGVFRGYSGTLSSINEETGEVTVIVSTVGRDIPVNLDKKYVEKAAN
jgi:hypothetical protein